MPKRLHVKGLVNVAVYVLIALPVLLAMAALRKGRPKFMRRIGQFKY